MSAKASPLTTNTKRKFDELYYDDHKNTANGGTPKKTSSKAKNNNNNNNIERTSPPDKRVKKFTSSASPKVVVLSSDSSSSNTLPLSKKVNRRQSTAVDNENSYSPSGSSSSSSSRENSCDTKETIIFIKKDLHSKGNELSDSIDSDEMPCISHKTVSLKRPLSQQQGFATPNKISSNPQPHISTTSTQSHSTSTPPIPSSSQTHSNNSNGNTTPKTPKTSFATPSSQSSNVSQKKISPSPFSQHFPNLTRPYLSSPRDTKSPLSTPIKTSSQVSMVSDNAPSPTSVKTGPNHQATLPILSQKPKKFPVSYSQKIGQCIWTPLESNSENEGMLEEFELFCIKTIRDQDSFIPDKALEILHTFDNDIKQAKLYVKEHPKQITRRRILTDEQEAKLYKAFNEFHLYKGSLRNLYKAVLPEVPYFDLVNYFFIYKKEESKVPPKLSKIVRNGLLRAAQMRNIISNQASSYQNNDSDSSGDSSSDDENCSDSATEGTPSRQGNNNIKKESNQNEEDDSGDESSDSEEEEEKLKSTPIKSHSNSNHIKSQTPHSTFCLSDSEEDVSFKDHEFVNDLAQYSNHDASSQEDRAYIPIENEDSTSTTEVNCSDDTNKKKSAAANKNEAEDSQSRSQNTTPTKGKSNLQIHIEDHHDEELDCSSPKPSFGASSSTCLATPLRSNIQQQQQQQPVMTKFVLDDETGKLVQAAFDEDEIQDYLDAEDSDYDEDDSEDYDDEYDLGDQLEKEFMDQVLEESMKTLDILSPVKPPAGSEHVFDFVTGGAQDILEKQLQFEDEEEEEILMTDFAEGIVKCIPLKEYEAAIEESSSSILMEACMAENSYYYNVFQSAMKRFYLDVKRFLITQSYRKKQNDPSLQVSSDEEEIKKKCYEVQPTLSYLENEIYDNFVPKSSQRDDILSDSEMIRIAQQIIKSKEERRKLFYEWTEECDRNAIAPDTKDEMEHFDDDPNDPEYEDAANKDELDKLKRFKTNGAHIRRIKIGQWSPTLNYDGQFLLKASPLLKKIYYKLFTYSPKYHIRPESLDEKEVLESYIVESSASKESFNDQVSREFDRFKVSHALWMEIDYGDIIGIHLQKTSTPKSIQDHPLGLLVLLLSKKPKFLTRRIACTDQQLNTLRERADFTNDKQASLYNRHYIIGDYRELKRVLSVILQSDDSGRLSRIYQDGMENIFETEPIWSYDPSEDDKFIDPSKDTIDEENLVRALPDEEGFFEAEDEEEEALYELEYDSDIGEFDFKNLGTTYQLSNDTTELDN
ncbi:hypothetical protein NAEGRDRAFT_79330 [Naegleria gruberi]|uniref:Uncharacterized protein n=1 Tax=Naegleria gruberi TaxID=5762 RepID=D2VBM2_NAEGR|nr:uncharacterized protein NAEGRDRAFT_79330 [Naegleria gruberi]EFC45820.1 hypothetical protein NAEGRDRAFT_79330 [Naegleria gruberi]|eukprot:XP_002678564.1 hypothetical protein NAEGRDRAFT_79330 [Naegleria gruberi strain NEG-M]